MAFGIKSAGLSISVCLAAAVVASTVTRDVQADVRCFPVSGKIHSLFTSTNCTSPVGLCTVGTIVGGDLDGATSFQALDAAPSAGLPAVEAAANLSYSGSLTIVAPRGTLTIRDLGVIDAAGLSFTEIERPASGTGAYASPSGDFFISGAITDAGDGFTGALHGMLCSDRSDR